ncbi:hypothetical protein CYY_005191 [Polysphondylium violaceum]|uniref:ribonuclease Z n=1 Tax=Polysphondylium violaceum TaxID=133409 RepID=A0A8J4PUS5_9MYCE|nr:hypothetical protein CYY_005191 [Polysphondylium violaceum]
MTKSYIDVTGDNEDATPILFANFDENRYLFEAGEGVQKVIRDLEAVSLPKVKAIFITSLSWDSIGGLIGLIFSLSDAGVESINMYSPKGLFKILKASRAFSCVPSLKIHLFELNNHLSHHFKVSNMNVTSIPLYKTLPTFKDVKMSRDIIVQNHYNNWDYEQMNQEDDYSENQVDQDAIVCYIGSTPDLPGKFHPDKAIKLGVEKGTNFSLLNSGQSVISKTTGLTVTSDMVKDPDQPGTRFALLRCPSKEYFNSLFNNDTFESFYSGKEKLCVVYHLVPESIITSQEYQQFIEKLSFENKNIKHILVNSENCERYPSYPSSDHYVKKLKALVPPLFQLQDKKQNDRQFNKLDIKNVISCEKVTRIFMAPLAKVGHLEIRPYQTDIHDIWEFHHHQDSYPEFKQEAQKVQQEIQRIENIQDKVQYPKVLFTGTGSAVPSRFRNVTGNYIALSEDKGLLLDAGECTYSQLYRSFGQDKIKDILLGIKLIWISHEHADHHLGVARVLLKRSQYTDEPLVVAGPPRFISWLTKLSVCSPNINFIGASITEKSEHLDQALKELDIESLVSIPVIHCDESVGVCIQLNSGVRIAYSGDTRPCPEFIEACKDSLVLIHESSFEDDQLEDAKSKNHSTIGEAIQVGRDMNAKCTLLTHFSQRFCQVQPNPPETIVNTEEKPFAAVFDFMYISPYQYSLLPHITKAINILLSEKK